MTGSHPTFFIGGNVPSSKNLQRCGCTKDNRPYMTSHERVKNYIQLTDPVYAKKAEKFYSGYQNGCDLANEAVYSYPVKIGFHFIRDSNRAFDFINACQLVADRMVHHQWVPDDDMRHFIPFPLYFTPPQNKIQWSFCNSWYSVSKYKPGVVIKIIGETS